MNDEKIWFKTSDGQEMFIYKTEKCDVQKELTDTINVLQFQLNKIKEIVDDCTEERYGADYFIIKDYFEDISSIVNGKLQGVE